jgi:hypothetical protein
MTVFLAVSYVILWLLVIVLFVALLALYNHFGNLYLVGRENRESMGQVTGDYVRAFETEALDGTPVIMPADGPLILLFVSTVCSTCKVLLDGLTPLSSAHPAVRVVLVVEGRPNMVRAWARDTPGNVTVIADPRGRISKVYDVDISPFAIAVGADHRVRKSGLINEYEGLVAAAELAESEPVDAQPVDIQIETVNQAS